MAQYLEVGNVVKVRINSYAPGAGPVQEGQNILYGRISSTTGISGTDYELAQAISNDIVVKYKSLLSQQASYYGVGVTILKPTPFIEQFYGGDSGAGTGGLLLLPLQVSGIITKQTGNQGRAQRGRIYIPFPAVSDALNGLMPNDAYVTKLNELGPLLSGENTYVISDSRSITMQWVLAAPDGGNTRDYRFFRANQAWATQRRRGAYGQPNLP